MTAPTTPMSQPVWRNAYYVGTPASQPREQRARRKVSVCRCHAVRTGRSKVSHTFVKNLANIFPQPVELGTQRAHQRYHHLGVLVRLYAHFFQFFIRHRHTISPAVDSFNSTVAEAVGGKTAHGGGLWK